MKPAPGEMPDVNTLVADIRSGIPANIKSALNQVEDEATFAGLSTTDRAAIVRAVTETCTTPGSISRMDAQQLALPLMNHYPEEALDFIGWMLQHNDPEIVDRGNCLPIWFKLAPGASVEKKAAFLALAQRVSPLLARELQLPRENQPPLLSLD